MPDGTLWDGWNYLEYRKVLDRAVKPYDRIQPGAANPGQTLIEDRAVGTVWKIKPSTDAAAWNLEENLADSDGLVGGPPTSNSRITPRGLETVNPRTWRDTPALWTSLQAPDNSWTFAYIDESDPDLYTRRRNTAYLEITRIWADDRFEFTGYSLDSGHLDGIVTVPDPKRYVTKDRFKGTFFLWPIGREDNAAGGRRLWQLIPADDARITPDDLAAAILTGQAELAVWDTQRIRDKVIWKRTIRDIQEAIVRPTTSKPPAPPPTPVWSDAATDLVVLNDGRWFRGRVTKKDDTEVTIITRIGQAEFPMTFKAAEVKEVQVPERK